MARVTVEDCIMRVPNRFDLVLLGARRARDVAAGAPLTVERDNDKNPVVALREIADATIDIGTLGDEIIRALQKHVEVDEPEAEMMELSASAEDLSRLAGEAAKAKVASEDEAGEEEEGENVPDIEAEIEEDALSEVPEEAAESKKD
ncbi:MAG TPA: DNA-directed RNA polymerase subunit omega [Alphaproteobacteria bacterium]|jgi:DNA-directed RNA polymerase subunit omega|nr:DNA-directed RNA polymerase subunit omega [Alphaproteobacteria bacterium]